MLGILIAILLVLGGAGFFGYKYLMKTGQGASSSETGGEKTAKTGVLQKVGGSGEDYSHLLTNPGQKSVGVSSSTMDLNKYNGKKVEVSGMYSGTTLYVDQLKEIEK